MRRWRVRAEEQTRDQTFTLHSTWEVRAANVESSKGSEIPVGRNVAVTTEQATRALVHVGDHHYVRLVIAGAGFQPCFPFTHIVGCSHVCVSVRATDLQASELVDQEEVDHTSHRIRSVHGRGAVLEDVNVIDHREGNKLNVVTEENSPLCDALAIHQDQGLFQQQAAQIELHGTVTAVAHVLVDRAACFLWYEGC
ncbi:MAG: hypothetical protein Udaeo2_18340 [Candidatus Udaeobacter sp.]|nr:MAG: hypothetical protein Udaeo2_18340 [Candidatus Udaeobacter sp.]